MSSTKTSATTEIDYNNPQPTSEKHCEKNPNLRSFSTTNNRHQMRDASRFHLYCLHCRQSEHEAMT